MVELLSASIVTKDRPYRRLEGIFLGQFPPTKPECSPFWEEPRVGFLSIHRWPFYPGTGDTDETGAGDALGTTLNLPIAFGTPRKEYLAAFSANLEKFAERIKPQLILLSAGFDTHRLDPVGNLGLETEDFAALTNLVLDAAAAHAGGRLVSVLDGGYDPQILADCVALQLAEMLKRHEPKVPSPTGRGLG